MAGAFDNRIIQLGIQVDGETKTYNQDFDIQAVGTKFVNSLMGECQVKIDNIDKIARNNLLTTTSPWRVPRTQALVTLDVGRESYGTFRMYSGNVLAGLPTQPPDIGLVLRSLTLSYMLGNIVAITMPETTSLEKIAKQVATSLGVTLDFRASPKQINNYTFNGAALKQVEKLCEAGGVDAFVDNDTLVVLDRLNPRSGNTILVSKETGMIGIPEITEQAVRVRCLINNEITTRDSITIESEINPAANGTFPIFKLGFEIASRQTPFYWVIEATKYRL